jgi:hypothetical protein
VDVERIVANGELGAREFQALPQEVQMAVLYERVNNQRGSFNDLKDEVRYMKRSLYGLIFTIGGALIVLLATGYIGK